MKQAQVVVGYTKTTLDNYKDWERHNLEGADITARDGVGNEIQVNVRPHGYRIILNGKDLNVSLLV